MCPVKQFMEYSSPPCPFYDVPYQERGHCTVCAVCPVCSNVQQCMYAPDHKFNGEFSGDMCSSGVSFTCFNHKTSQIQWITVENVLHFITFQPWNTKDMVLLIRSVWISFSNVIIQCTVEKVFHFQLISG